MLKKSKKKTNYHWLICYIIIYGNVMMMTNSITTFFVFFPTARRSAPQPDPSHSSTSRTCSGPWTRCTLCGKSNRRRRRKRRRWIRPRPRTRSNCRNAGTRYVRSSKSFDVPSATRTCSISRLTLSRAAAVRHGPPRRWTADNCWKRRRSLPARHRSSMRARSVADATTLARARPWGSPRPCGTPRRPRPTGRWCLAWACPTWGLAPSTNDSCCSTVPTKRRYRKRNTDRSVAPRRSFFSVS